MAQTTFSWKAADSAHKYAVIRQPNEHKSEKTLSEHELELLAILRMRNEGGIGEPPDSPQTRQASDATPASEGARYTVAPTRTVDPAFQRETDRRDEAMRVNALHLADWHVRYSALGDG